MHALEVKVTFQPGGHEVFVLPGTLVLEAAARAGIILQTPCGGAGSCGKCRVRIVSGQAAEECEKRNDGYVLACMTRVSGPLAIEVPVESRFEYAQRILTDHVGATFDIDHAIRADVIELAPPTREDDRPDLERIEAALATDLRVAPTLWSRLPSSLRDADWRVRLVRDADRLIDILPMESNPQLLGIAFDLGTTTIVGTALDLETGIECGVAAGLNPQITLGDDVLSRIRLARERPGALKELQVAAIGAMNAIVKRICPEPGDAARVVALALAGNTTMQELVCGIDPRALGELPFVPAFADAMTFEADRLGLEVNPAAGVYVFPQIGGFVGGDTVAGLLAAGFDRLNQPTLLVDIGTNGEIALLHDNVILCASTAAGPAFEGARIRHGMRATTGAIEKIVVANGDIDINIVGNAPAAGLCGTALIDVVAELLRLGVIDDTGRLLEHAELPDELSEALRGRIAGEPGKDHRFILASSENGAREVCLFPRDIRELQLASGALRAGIDTLMQKAGLQASDLGGVLLAGAFGNFIRRNNAQRIGLIPELPHERINCIGNAASMGAKMALLSHTERERAQALRDRCRHVDLSTHPDFQTAFSQAMLFPPPGASAR